MSTAAKKRRLAADGEEIELTVKSAFDLMKSDGPTLFMELSEYVKAQSGATEDVIEIMAASYFKSAEMENKYVVPPEFRAFKADRNRHGEIERITDGQNNTITGKQLSGVLAYSALKEKGFKTLIKGKASGSVEMLAIPNGMQIDAATNLKTKKDFHKNVRMLYTHKSSTTVYVDPALIVGILELDYVTPGDISCLMKAINALAAKEDLGDFDFGKLGNVNDIRDAIDADQAKQTRKHFFEALFAAKIAAMDTSERLDLFAKNPSYTVANNIGLRLPHGGPCFVRTGNKLIAPVPLESLGDDDSVLLSTNVMSLKDYNETAGNVGQYLVYKNTMDLGGRKGIKWVPMSVKFAEPVKNVRRYMEAISASNAGRGAGVSEPAPTNRPGEIAVDLEF